MKKSYVCATIILCISQMAFAQIATPALSTPAAGATGIAVLPTLTWGTVAGAVTYRVQVSAMASFNLVYFDDSTVTTGTRTLTNPLSGSAVYYWRVNAKNAAGTTSAWATYFSFTTVTDAAPAAPLLTAPANNATGQPVAPALTWGTVPFAATYRVQVSTVSTFATTLVDDSTLTAATRAVTGLTGQTTYFWRVNAKSTNGTSVWSSINSFTTTLGTPLLSTPISGAAGIAVLPTLSWGTVAGAVTYRVQVFATDYSMVYFDDSTVTTGTRTLTNALSGSATYYWRVNAKNATGTTSAWASFFSFTTVTIAAPAAPLLTTPANAATGQAIAPTLTWGTVPSATTYHVQVATVSTFSTTVADDSTLTAGTRAVTGLTSQTTYFWRVNAKNVYGTSVWSSINSFTTTLATPILSTPIFGAAGIAVLPTFTWGTVAGAVTYRVQVSATSSFNSVYYDDSTVIAGTRTLTNALSGSAVYYWRVNAKNAAGTTSAWATYFSFTTVTDAPPAAPLLGTPANAKEGNATSPVLTWGTVPGVATYRVQLATVSTFASTVVDDSTLTAVTRAVTGLTNLTTYFWRVNAKNVYGTSAWSSINNFITNLAAPVLTAPATASTGIAVSLTLTWGTVTGAATYRIQVSTISTFTTTVANDSTLTAGTMALTGLANNTTYYWRANAKNAGGTSAWSVVFSFTTLLAAPILTFPASGYIQTSGTLALTWGTATGASTYRVQVSTVSTFATTYTDDSTLTAGTKSIIFTYPSPPTNGTYYWRVNAKNAGGSSAWSTVWTFRVMIIDIAPTSTPQYAPATMGHNGVLEVYMTNGRRVMEAAYEAKATKAQLLNAASKSLAKGYYMYRFQSLDAKFEIVGKLVK